MKCLTQSEKKRQRQEEILLSLEIMRFATRDQIQRKHQLGTDRNALKILNEMKEYLQIRNHEGRNVYYLSARGRELVGLEEEIKWTQQTDHHLMRNDIWLHYFCPKDWRVEESIKFVDGLQQLWLVPDAIFTAKGKHHFVEIDNTQKMQENKKKIELYAKLNPLIKQQFGHEPVLVFYTITDLRRTKLKEYCKEKNVDCLIYTKQDLL